MGVVYRARDTKLKRLIALKMILAGDYAGPELLARFRKEAEVLARLQHPGIVQIYEVGEQDSRPYIAMELVEGGTLAERLAGAPLAPAQAAQLVRELALAVEHAHHCGVLHRDLKPGNILITREGQPKVSDFGLAKLLGENAAHTQSGAIVGTPSYMAPEQAAGHVHDVGPATDVYALGTILYESLTGRPPFKAPTTIQVLDQVRFQEPVPPSRLQPDLPRSLELICLKCLEKESQRRYASAKSLAEDLRRFLANEPILARPPGWLARFLLWSRRPERIRDAGAFTVFLGVVFILWSLAGLATVGGGALLPPDGGQQAMFQMAMFVALCCVPLVIVGLGTMARRRFWLWAGVVLAAFFLAICMICLVSNSPIEITDMGGLYRDPYARIPMFQLLAVLAAVQCFGYCVAIRAYHANRDAVR
jgi:serine/threonine-protein kinase